MNRRVLMAAGGTGGHLFPARATAETLVRQGWSVRLVTDERGARHTDQFPGEGVDQIEAGTPFTKNPVKMIKALGQLSRGIGQARRIIDAYQPDVVAGFGGYPAFPAMVAADRTNTPIVIHEQNAVLGRVNRLFAGKAFVVASGFERLDKMSSSARHVVTGNPVREAVMATGRKPYMRPYEDGPLNLLIIGGSLGARILSETVPRAVAMLPEDMRNRLVVTQQTRAENLDDAREVYASAGVKAECEAFFDTMGTLYANAHLVISRAGASSVAEIAALGRPALFVPLAIAMDDHQTANAEDLVKAGAAVMVPESELSVESLAQQLKTLLDEPSRLSSMAGSALSKGKSDAHEHLADLINKAARSRNG